MGYIIYHHEMTNVNKVTMISDQSFLAFVWVTEYLCEMRLVSVHLTELQFQYFTSGNIAFFDSFKRKIKNFYPWSV